MDHDLQKYYRTNSQSFKRKKIKRLERTRRKSLESMDGIKKLLIYTKMFATMGMMYLKRNHSHVEGQFSFL